MTALPIHTSTGGTSQEFPVARADALRDDVLDFLKARGHKDLITEGATRERVDEPKRQDGRDFADLVLQVVGTDGDRPGYTSREFFVPRQEDPVLEANPFDEGPIRARLKRIRLLFVPRIARVELE